MRIWKRYETITQPTHLTWKPTDASSAGCTSQITQNSLSQTNFHQKSWHWYLYEHVRGKEITECIFFLFIISTLRFYLEISARYISLSTPTQQRWDIKNNKFSPAVFVARHAVPVTRDKLQIALWTLCTGIIFCWRNGLWEQLACAVD